MKKRCENVQGKKAGTKGEKRRAKTRRQKGWKAAVRNVQKPAQNSY
jgi:hypothetical protein